VTIFELLQQLLECAANALDATSYQAPSRQCITAGEPVWEDCCDDSVGNVGGQLTVNVVRYYPSTTFPDEDSRVVTCGPPLRAADINVQVLRCAPVWDGNGSAPCDDTVAERLDSDSEALWNGVICCLLDLHRTEFIEWTLRQQVVNGPEGGCVGSTLTITVGMPSTCGCA
jgi:hypothetical protein